MTTDQLFIAALAGAVLLLLGLLIGILAGRRARPVTAPSTKPDLVPLAPAGATTLPALPGPDTLQPMVADLRDRLAGLQDDVRALQTATAAGEARRGPEDQAWQSIQRVERALASLSPLPHQQQSLQDQFSGALRDIAAIKELQAEHRQRWSREDVAFTSLQRLTAVMLGSARAGAAGERLVQETLANLPAQWRAANHDVAGKQVEFAVRLPDGLILPIDSKVVAQADLDALDQQTDPSQRDRLERAIRATLRQRAAEVRQYVDQRTPGFAILAVPDAAYHLSGPILPDVYRDHRALLVPYSLLGPFILMVYEQHQRSGIDLESARVAHALADAQTHVETALHEIEGRLSDALTRLTNGRDTLRHELADAAQALILLRHAASRDSIPPA